MSFLLFFAPLFPHGLLGVLVHLEWVTGINDASLILANLATLWLCGVALVVEDRSLVDNWTEITGWEVHIEEVGL